MPRKIGYARVSTEEQNADLQRRALRRAGCAVIFEDKGFSGASRSRPGLAKALKSIKPGDTLVVWKLDRFGRSLSHLIALIEQLRQEEIGFCTLQEQIDTTRAGGRFYMHILGALAEFEREMISERTRAGMAAAKERGQRLGRPERLSLDDARKADAMIRGGMTRRDTAKALGVDAMTLRRALRKAGLNPPYTKRRRRRVSRAAQQPSIPRQTAGGNPHAA